MDEKDKEHLGLCTDDAKIRSNSKVVLDGKGCFHFTLGPVFVSVDRLSSINAGCNASLQSCPFAID